VTLLLTVHVAVCQGYGHSHDLILHITASYPDKGFWKGSWGCDLCTKDDDFEIKQWQVAFTAALARSASFRNVKSCVIAMTVSSPTSDPSAPNAEIKVDCGKGINMNKLGVAGGTFLARALQRSFAKVQGSDDFSLTGVAFRAAATKTGTSSALALNADEANLERRRPPPPSLSGSMGCRMCGDGTWSIAPGVKGAKEILWGTELVAALRMSQFAPFREVTKCLITVVPFGSKDIDVDEATIDE
jgi:hypothetical protein